MVAFYLGVIVTVDILTTLVTFLIIYKQNKSIMGEEVNINAALDKVQAALGNIANDIRKLGEDVAGGVSKAEAVKITARANAIADTAQALADVTPGGEETPPAEEGEETPPAE